MDQFPITLLPFTLTLLLLFPPSTSTASLYSTAAQSLIHSGFLSMALTLRLASPTLPPTPTATIFVPSDTAFLRSGPLPLSLLKYHIIPSRLPLQHLTSLPLATNLHTLLPNSPLFVTAASLSPLHLTINNVTVASTPLYDDGSLLMLSLHDFFNSSSLLLPDSLPSNTEPFASVLKSNGCSLTATFLEARLTELSHGTKLTVFAPADEAIMNIAKNVSDYSAILWKHVVPRLIPWRDLIHLPDETLLPTLSHGFAIRLTVSPRVRLLNGVTIAFPDMYHDELLIVHRVDGLLDNSMV